MNKPDVENLPRLVSVDLSRSRVKSGETVWVATTRDVPGIVIEAMDQGSALNDMQRALDNLFERGVIPKRCEVQPSPTWAMTSYLWDGKKVTIEHVSGTPPIAAGQESHFAASAH